jgi:uncharacterized protein
MVGIINVLFNSIDFSGFTAKIHFYMLETIEKLLILQDRDQHIARVKNELSRVEPERQMLNEKMTGAQSGLEAAKLRGKQIESERKKLELDVEAKKAQIEKYALQQFQTKKNEEYRALAHEIETCKQVILKLDDQQIELMEKAEGAQKDVVVATQTSNEAKKLVEGQVANLGARETNLKKELAELESNREQLLSAVDESTRSRYERLLKNKGSNVVVGVQHGVCGGCHMKLPVQIIVSCQAQQEIVTCINCGRILYYTRDMDLVAAD